MAVRSVNQKCCSEVSIKSVSHKCRSEMSLKALSLCLITIHLPTLKNLFHGLSTPLALSTDFHEIARTFAAFWGSHGVSRPLLAQTPVSRPVCRTARKHLKHVHAHVQVELSLKRSVDQKRSGSQEFQSEMSISVDQKRCSEVSLRSAGQECRPGVLLRSRVAQKCRAEVLLRSVAQKCWSDVPLTCLRECCSEAPLTSVAQNCCPNRRSEMCRSKVSEVSLRASLITQKCRSDMPGP